MHRYRSLLSLAILFVASGVITASAPLLIVGVIPLLFVLHGAIATAPIINGRVRVERELEPETPLPGEQIEVTLTVQNVGDAAIPDLRFVDGVPAELGVTDGSPRGSGPLRAGQAVSTTYTLITNRGAYEFDDVDLRARNVSGTRVTDATIEAAGKAAFESLVSIEDVPVGQETTPYTGALATDSGGPGIEFHATREYRSGDPVKRINWNRYAKTGDLSTIEYREQRAAHVAVVIDSREPAHVAAGASLPSGATLSAYAATLAVGVLSDMGHHVSVGALGTQDPITGRSSPAWASTEERESFATHAVAICNDAATGSDEAASAGMATLAADGGSPEHKRLRARLPPDAQVLFCTPAVDDEPADLVESLAADGHETTVLSPRVTPGSVGGRVTDLERTARLHRLRMLGATVVDWNRDERLPVALGRTLEAGVE